MSLTTGISAFLAGMAILAFAIPVQAGKTPDCHDPLCFKTASPERLIKEYSGASHHILFQNLKLNIPAGKLVIAASNDILVIKYPDNRKIVFTYETRQKLSRQYRYLRRSGLTVSDWLSILYTKTPNNIPESSSTEVNAWKWTLRLKKTVFSGAHVSLYRTDRLTVYRVLNSQGLPYPDDFILLSNNKQNQYIAISFTGFDRQKPLEIIATVSTR